MQGDVWGTLDAMRYDLSTATVQSVSDATQTAIDEAEALVDRAVRVAEPTYASCIAPLDEALRIISDAAGYGPFLAHCHRDKAVREVGNEAKEQLDKWSNYLVFRPEVFRAVSKVDAEHLTGLAQRSTKLWHRDLRRAGHELNPTEQSELRDLRSRLIELGVAFSRNLAEYADHLDIARDDLAGLPEGYVAGLGEGDEPDTVRVTLDYPDYVPFMQQASNRGNRRRLQHKFLNRAVSVNRPLLAEAIRVRSRIADLLGYETWAHHQMELKMADVPSVRTMYDSIMPGLTERAVAEKAALQALLEVDHPGETLQAWDWGFYDTQQERTDFGVDQNTVAEYFALENVLTGMFEITGRVFGISYELAHDIPTWHPDVRTYRIVDTGSGDPIAVFFLDLHPRDGKFTHAACWQLQSGCRSDDGSYRTPYAAVLCNFTKPTKDRPSLLKHDEVVTLFHEFGHVLHDCLTEVDLARFAGADTEWDFVEAPSQIMENWTWDAGVLQTFATHYATGEPIGQELVDRLTQLRDHNVALKLLRQVYLGNLDLALHTSGPEPDLEAIDEAEHALTQIPIHEDTFMAAGFGHLMDAYDAGYYGYLWSMVYGDDMFSVFEEEGIMSPAVGARYRKEVLAQGYARDAIEHLRAFLGREPNAAAFMAKIGLSSD